MLMGSSRARTPRKRAVVPNNGQHGRDGAVVSSNGQHDLAAPEIHAAYRLSAAHLYRDLGRFAYAAFDHINATYFGGAVPETLILWDLTDYGHSLGWCRSSADGPPIIKLHPNLVYSPNRPMILRQETRWHIPVELLGRCYAYDVLLHEMIHAHINYDLGGWERLDGPQRKKWTCHNNPLWVGECNRIAALLGYQVNFEMKKYRRVEGQVKYGCDGPDFEHFPHSIPGREDFYRAGELPFEVGGVVQNLAQQAGAPTS
jgi:hypothetical protein